MKKILTNYIAWIILAVMFILLIPSLNNRIYNENKNNNVTISLLFNDIRTKVSNEVLSKTLKEYKSKGLNVISLMEEDVNSLVARGDITSIKYNILRHKYDDESMRVADVIKENCPGVAYDSHILLVKKDYAKKQLSHIMPLKYDKSEYMKIENVERMDIYVLYDGRKNLWDISLGYDEEVIKGLVQEGFEVALVIITRFLRAKEFFGIESLLYVMLAVMAVFILVLTLVFIKYLSSYLKLKKYLKKIDKNTEK